MLCIIYINSIVIDLILLAITLILFFETDSWLFIFEDVTDYLSLLIF
jgi:hypothetical protein